MAVTRFLGLHYYGGDTPGSITDNGSQHTNADRIVLDEVIGQLVTAGRHYIPPTAKLSPTPSLALNTTGGTLPDGIQVCYRIGLIGLDGFERMAGAETSIFTPGILLAPDAPGLRDSSGGNLSPGLYYYALTVKSDEQESILGGQTSVNVFVGINQSVYIDAPDDDQEEQLQIWRRKDTDPGWTRIALVGPGDTFLDDGSVPAERYSMDPSFAPPTTNNGLATNSVTVSLTGDAAAAAVAGAIAGWRIYRSTISGFYSSQSLVHQVVETDDPDGNGDGLLRTSWVDTGDGLLTGTPQNKDRTLTFTPYAPESAATLPTDVTGYPDNYPIVVAGRLFLLVNRQWTAASGTGTVITYGTTLPDPATRSAGDLHLDTATGIFYAIEAGAWVAAYTPKKSLGGGSPILTSPDGNRWRTTVDNDGTLRSVPTFEPGPPAVPTNPYLED